MVKRGLGANQKLNKLRSSEGRGLALKETEVEREEINCVSLSSKLKVFITCKGRPHKIVIFKSIWGEVNKPLLARQEVEWNKRQNDPKIRKKSLQIAHSYHKTCTKSSEYDFRSQFKPCHPKNCPPETEQINALHACTLSLTFW